MVASDLAVIIYYALKGITDAIVKAQYIQSILTATHFSNHQLRNKKTDVKINKPKI